MQKYTVTEETPMRLSIQVKESDPFFLLTGGVVIGFGVIAFALGVTHLCIFGAGLLLTIVGIAIISRSQAQHDWTFNKEKKTVIHKTLNVFRQSVVKQEYHLHDIQHAFIDKVEPWDDESSTSYYPALKLASGETILLMRLYYGQDLKDQQKLMDRINAWMKSGGV